MTVESTPLGIRTDTPDPLWLQAAASITREINDGTFALGTRLPAERELCQRLNISRVTLRKSLTKLVEDGLVTPSHGRGWYVGAATATRSEWPTTLESFSETAQRMRLTATSRVLRCELAPATIDEAEELGIVPGMAIFHLDRVRMLGGIPIASDHSRVPAGLVPEVEFVDFTRASLYDTLAEVGIDPSRAETTIESRAADAELAEQLDIEPGSPVLVMHQLVTTAADRPVLASTIKYAGDRYRLRTSFVRSSTKTKS